MAKSTLIVKYLRAQAWSRLDTAGPNALRAARNVVSLLDTAAYLADMPDDSPVIVALEAAGCFRGDVFSPGPEGEAIVRGWQLADEQTGGPEELLSALAAAAGRTPLNVVIPAQATAEQRAIAGF